MRSIEFGNENVRYTDEAGRVHTVGLSRIAQALNDYRNGGGPHDFAEEALLPPAVRWISADATQVVLERPPQRCPVYVGGAMKTIPVPWSVWLFQFDETGMLISLRILARFEQISSPEDALSYYPFPNTDVQGYVLEETLKTIANAVPGSLAALLQSVIVEYWNEECSLDTVWLEHMPMSIRYKAEGSINHGYQELADLSVAHVLADAFVSTEERLKDAFVRPYESPQLIPPGNVFDTLVKLTEIVP